MDQRIVAAGNASIFAVAARIRLPWLGVALAGALLLGIAYWVGKRRPPASCVSGLALVASILAAPAGWIGYGVLLLPCSSHVAGHGSWWRAPPCCWFPTMPCYGFSPADDQRCAGGGRQCPRTSDVGAVDLRLDLFLGPDLVAAGLIWEADQGVVNLAFDCREWWLT